MYEISLITSDFICG